METDERRARIDRGLNAPLCERGSGWMIIPSLDRVNGMGETGERITR